MNISQSKIIGQRLKKFIEIRFENIENLCSELSKKPKTIYSYISGNAYPKFGFILSLVKDYDLNPNWFFTGEGEILLSKENLKVKEDNAPYGSEEIIKEQILNERAKIRSEYLKTVISNLKEANASNEMIQQAIQTIITGNEKYFRHSSKPEE